MMEEAFKYGDRRVRRRKKFIRPAIGCWNRDFHLRWRRMTEHENHGTYDVVTFSKS